LNEDARQQFTALLQRHRAIVFKVAGSYARDREDREELAQEIATQLWRAYPRYDARRPFTTWMYRVALNVGISHLRSARPQSHEPLDDAVHELADEGIDPGGQADLRELYRCIAQLAPLDRALLLLYLEDRNQREIAEVLGISETNVATKLHRLKQRLRDQVAPTAKPRSGDAHGTR
jgi:RNA polymerase sigma-70 factor (ECF subfamily)